MLEFNALPAKEGDALWIKWGDPDSPHQMLVDLGTERIGRDIRLQFAALPVDQRAIDLLVVTHVDRDHIGGVLTCFAEEEPLPGFNIQDVWFNGHVHLLGGTVPTTASAQPAGAVQGERLTRWLRTQNWNLAFDGGPVQRVPDSPPKSITLHDNLRLTVLGPTPERLRAFTDRWEAEVQEAIKAGRLDAEDLVAEIDIAGSATPPVLAHEDDLITLANSHVGSDHSEANGSSISLLLEYEDTVLLLAGDAFSADLVSGINALPRVADQPLHLDLYKLPHHGSRNNVHQTLIEQVTCDRWLVSSDGTRFRHPDAEAIARIIAFSRQETPTISFNVPSTFNQWWDNPIWRQKFGYRVEYGNPVSGLQLRY